MEQDEFVAKLKNPEAFFYSHIHGVEESLIECVRSWYNSNSLKILRETQYDYIENYLIATWWE